MILFSKILAVENHFRDFRSITLSDYKEQVFYKCFKKPCRVSSDDGDKLPVTANEKSPAVLI